MRIVLRVPRKYWTFLGPGSEEKWSGDSHAQKGEWDSWANKMVQQFKETGPLGFKSISVFESWNFEAEER